VIHTAAVPAKAGTRFSADSGTDANQNAEFGGTALPRLSIDARRTLTSMGAELSA